jgi:hypothetical protein
VQTATSYRLEVVRVFGRSAAVEAVRGVQIPEKGRIDAAVAVLADGSAL